MASGSGTTTTMSIKLVIDPKQNKVLYAEAGKDFVDFLFNLLAFPVGSVIGLLKKENMVGSLCKLYESVERLSLTYMQPNIDKNSLLKPKITTSSYSTSSPLLVGDEQKSGLMIFMCNKKRGCASHKCVSVDSQLPCPNCSKPMSVEVKQVVKEVDSASSVGFVTGGVTYMVMDDLVVEPIMSSDTIIDTMNKFDVKDVRALKRKVVDINMAEGLKILKESLQSEMVLTNVFLPKSEMVLNNAYKGVTTV